MDHIEQVYTAAAPRPGGHYAQASAFGEFVFVSGQLPVPASGEHAPTQNFETQARAALTNLLAILEAAGSSRDQVVRVTAYLVGVENWPLFNRIYAELFGDARPARTVVPVPELHYGYLVEVDAIAVRSC